MSNYPLLFIAVISTCGISQVYAQNTVKQTHEQHYKEVNKHFKSAMKQCAGLKYKEQAQCRSNALAHRELQKANLKANLEPTIQNRYNANLLKAEINFNKAFEKCALLNDPQLNICTHNAKNSHSHDTALAKAQRNVEMNQTILRNKDLLVEKFNSKSSPFISIDLRKPSTYKT